MVRWLYDGKDLRVVESAGYLGYPMQAVGGKKPWKGKLKGAGLKASFVLQGVVKKHDLYGPELQLRLFDTFVKPAMSYGCQIWGADHTMHSTPESALDNPLQRIHLRYLRIVSGVANHVPNVALLHELKASPIVCHWLRLVLRFWNQMVINKQWILHKVFKANVHHALQGLRVCWAAKVLDMLVVLGELSMANLCASNVCSMVIDVEKVVNILHTRVMHSLTAVHVNPRLCEDRVKLCTYFRWFAHPDGSAYHPHVKCTNISAGKHRELMRFRLGCAVNAVNIGRFVDKSVKKPRAERICPCCASGQAEDELHMVFECAAYHEIRSRNMFAVLFIGGGHDMLTLFGSPQHQSLLADFVRAMSVKREQIVNVAV